MQFEVRVESLPVPQPVPLPLPLPAPCGMQLCEFLCGGFSGSHLPIASSMREHISIFVNVQHLTLTTLTS